MARRKRRKSRNPATPWLKYALIAGGCYMLYRLIKGGGLLGGDGDDYNPDPVVAQVSSFLETSQAKAALRSNTGSVIVLKQKKNLYDTTRAKYNAAPNLVTQAENKVKTTNTQIATAKALAENFIAKARANSNTNAKKALLDAADAQSAKAQTLQDSLPQLEGNVRAAKEIKPLAAKELVKLEKEMSDTAKEAKIFTQAAEVAVEMSKE